MHGGLTEINWGKAAEERLCPRAGISLSRSGDSFCVGQSLVETSGPILNVVVVDGTRLSLVSLLS